MPENLLDKLTPWFLGIAASFITALVSWRISAAQTEGVFNTRIEHMTAAIDRAFSAISSLQIDVKKLGDAENSEGRAVGIMLSEVNLSLRHMSETMGQIREDQRKLSERLLDLERGQGK